MTSNVRKVTDAVGVSPTIHQQAFALWHELDHPTYKTIHDILEKQFTNGEKIPSTATLKQWHTYEDWEERSDALYGQAEAAGDKEIIKQRANIIRKGAEIGAKLIDFGMDYLNEHKIDNSADAIRAINSGMVMEEKLLGWAAVFQKLSQADDAELNTMLKKYMTGEIIEATAIDATEQPNNTE